MVHKHFDAFSVSLNMTKLIFSYLKVYKNITVALFRVKVNSKFKLTEPKSNQKWKADDLNSISVFRINAMSDIKSQKKLSQTSNQ